MKYVIYAFIDNNNKPYYIGKTGNYKQRCKDHLFAIKNKDMLPKYQKARALFGKGHKFTVKVLASAASEEDSYLIERAFIKDYMKRGFKLTNMTKGGPDEEPLEKKANNRGRTSKLQKEVADESNNFGKWPDKPEEKRRKPKKTGTRGRPDPGLKKKSKKKKKQSPKRNKSNKRPMKRR